MTTTQENLKKSFPENEKGRLLKIGEEETNFNY